MKTPKSAQRKFIQIDKDLKATTIAIGIACFALLFAILSIDTLFSQMNLQNNIISSQKTAYNNLILDKHSIKSLLKSYSNFVNKPVNVIGGNPQTNTGNNGDNAKIVLDALPSSYDYPALLSSIQNLLSSTGVTINNISGSDNPPASSSGSGTSSPQAMSISFSVTAPLSGIQLVFSNLEHSIRPFQVQNMEISGDQSNLTLQITAQTYYQPSIIFKVTKEAVK
jgi:hypothetical protein